MNNLLGKLLSLSTSKNLFLAIAGKKGKPLCLGLVLHTEQIYEKNVFDSLIDLSKLINFKATLCVTTPKNPYVKSMMEKRNVSEKEFTDRLKILSGLYNIGLHGHWCKKSESRSIYNAKVVTEIERNGFVLTLNEPEEIKKQFKEEYEYLKNNIYAPIVYTAGWWYLNKTIVKLLDYYNFKFDCSARYGLPDSFGGEYLQKPAVRGIPSYISSSNKVVELPSISYLHMNWWTITKDLYPMLTKKEGPLFAVLPIHDYNLPDNFEKVKDNVAFLTSINNVKWTEVNEKTVII